MKEEIRNKFIQALGAERVIFDEPMSKHTTFRIGGPADVFAMPETYEQIGEILKLCKAEGLPFFVLGNGSNLLVSDKGYRGVIIQMDRNMQEIRLEGNTIRACAGALLSSIAVANGSNLLVSDKGYRGVIIQMDRNMQEIRLEGNTIRACAGALLSSIAVAARNASLTGFEFAGGIPGTLGGACVMNAGAYGGEMKDVLKEVMVMTRDGEILTLPAEKLEMGYRTSIIKKMGYLVLEAVISLEKGDEEAIRDRMKELSDLRTQKQPLDLPSAGSTFKRPTGKGR